MRNLFVLKQQQTNYDISKGLINSNDYIANKLNGLGYKTKVVVVVDDNAIDKEIFKFRPDNVFIEAIWCRPSKLRDLSLRYPKVKFSVRIHSKFPFLSHEGIAMDWINQYRDIGEENCKVGISANNADFSEDLSKVINFRVDYLPNMYFPHHLEISKKIKRKHKDVVNVSCFGAIRPLKNMLEQAVAAIIFADRMNKKLVFHINAGRTEQGGDSVLKNLRSLFNGHKLHDLAEHAWMNHHDLIKLQKQMDLAMGVSMSESFMLTLADAIFCEIPTVGSVDTDWIPSAYRATPTDTNDIVSKLVLSYKLPKLNVLMCSKALKKHNETSIKIWERYLLG